MALRLDVPLYVQQTRFSCWWAAERMILRYFGIAVRRPSELHSDFRAPEYTSDFSRNAPLLQPHEWILRGVPPEGLGTLAELTGFRSLSRRPAGWSARTIERTLRKRGPIWFYGVRSFRPHAVVLTGVDRTSVYLNDPGAGCRVRESLECFRQRIRLAWDLAENPLCYSGPPRARPARSRYAAAGA